MSDQKAKFTARVRGIQEELALEHKYKAHRKRMTREYRAFLKLPATASMPFFCRPCHKDFVAPAWKEWNFLYDSGAWFTRCPDCDGECARYISRKTSDPYYEESEEIMKMRGEFAQDMLRPDQYGFRTLYGEPFAGWEAEKQRRDEELRAKYAGLGIKGTTLKEKAERESPDFTEAEVFGEN